MTTMTTIAIMVGTPVGTRLLAASSERDAAVAAETLICGLARAALPAPVWVQCADPALARRLAAYLRDLQTDLLRDVAAKAH